MTQASERSVERIENMCGGTGHVLVERFLDEAQMGASARLYAKASIEVGATLGYHEHHGESETYYILAGEGMYNDNGREYPVKAGDVTFTDDGQGHGMRNTGTENLVFMALILKR